MTYDSHTPRTTKQRLPQPFNGTIYTTTRAVSSEKPLPLVGDTMENELGAAYKNSRIIAVSDGPNQEKGVLTITHAIIPSESEQTATNWEQSDVQITDKLFPGVVVSVIMLASEYSESSPAPNSALPVIPKGLFSGKNYQLLHRECVKTGLQLEPVFRLDRRTYVRADLVAAYKLSLPSRVNIDLPRVLKSVSVLWNQQYSIGTQDTYAFDQCIGSKGSISLSIPDSASSSASISAEVQVTFHDFATNNLFADNLEFFIESPVTVETVLAKINTSILGTTEIPAHVQTWPVFKPVSETISVVGQTISCRANVHVALSYSWNLDSDSESKSANKSLSDDFSVGISNNSVQIPPCIHGPITISGGTSKSQAVAATATMALALSNGTSISASKTKSGTAYGVVSPTALAATSGGSSVPSSGLYMLDMAITPADYRWYKVKAQIFDADQLS